MLTHVKFIGEHFIWNEQRQLFLTLIDGRICPGLISRSHYRQLTKEGCEFGTSREFRNDFSPEHSTMRVVIEIGLE